MQVDLSKLNPPQHWRAAVYWGAFAIFVLLFIVDLLLVLGVIVGDPIGIIDSAVSTITTLLAAGAALLAGINTPRKPRS